MVSLKEERMTGVLEKRVERWKEADRIGKWERGYKKRRGKKNRGRKVGEEKVKDR